MRHLRLACFALFFSSSVQASSQYLYDDYEKLRDVPADYSSKGSICEYIAKLRLQERYPESEYQIEIGIEYRTGARVIGELDVVVFRRSDAKAVVVSEVKCRRRLNHAAEYATTQLLRFQDTINSSRPITLAAKGIEERKYYPQQFDHVEEFLKISQDGGLVKGFDMTIGYDLEEADELRHMLMQCQRRGECPRIPKTHDPIAAG